MNMPTPGKVNKPIVSKRSIEEPRLTPKELQAFMKLYGFGDKEFAELLGVTLQAVRLWTTGEREFSITNSRLITMFKKYPQLMKEF